VPGQGQPGGLGVAEIVVDADRRAAARREHGGGRHGAIAGLAVHPDLAGGYLAEMIWQFVEGNVRRARDMTLLPLKAAADVDHDRRVTTGGGRDGGCEVTELGEPQRGKRPAAGPVLHPPGRGGRRAVDPDPDQLPLCVADLFRCLAQQRDWLVPGDRPAQVGSEAAIKREAERAGHEAGREGDPVPQVNHPLAGLDATADLRRVGPARRREVRSRGPGDVGRSHVGVVGGPCVQARDQFLDVILLAAGEHRIGPLLPADRGRPERGLGGRAEAAEPVRGEDLG
jgi:hypothetical protein